MFPGLFDTLTPERMEKALQVFSRLEAVTGTTRLIDLEAAQQLINTVDRDLATLPDKHQGASLVAELLNCYPTVTKVARADDPTDFTVYTLKLFEAFSVFPLVVCKAAVHAGTGVPSLTKFRPQPSEIATFCKAEMSRRLDAKTMAQRHLAEAKRREAQRIEDAKYRLSPEAKARVRALVDSFKAQAIPHDHR